MVKNSMLEYEQKALKELEAWKRKMTHKPSVKSRLTKSLQSKINGMVPEKAHQIITGIVKNMVKAILIGSEFASSPPLIDATFEQRESMVKERISFYKRTAAISGAGTGGAGLLMGMADFPILLSLKIKFLYETASIYGFNAGDLRERLFILHVFQLTFSSDEKRIEVYNRLINWKEYIEKLPSSIDSFDWRTFQQEYRDYMDIAKLLQLVPGLGAIVGAYANYKLLDKLGETAVNCYRLRLFNKH